MPRSFDIRMCQSTLGRQPPPRPLANMLYTVLIHLHLDCMYIHPSNSRAVHGSVGVLEYTVFSRHAATLASTLALSRLSSLRRANEDCGHTGSSENTAQQRRAWSACSPQRVLATARARHNARSPCAREDEGMCTTSVQAPRPSSARSCIARAPCTCGFRERAWREWASRRPTE